MAVDLNAIHVALAEQVEANIDDEYNVAAFPYSGKPVPSIEVWPGEPYRDLQPEDGTFCREAVNLRLRIRVAAANSESAFQVMARALSSGTGATSSLVDAVQEIDPTLGGVVLDTEILSVEWSPTDEDLGAIAEIPVVVTVER